MDRARPCRLIFDEDGYSRCEVPEVGDVVVYRASPRGEISHVGQVVSVKADIKEARFEVLVLSKWGADGEYLHPVGSVPSTLGSHHEFWSERITL